MNAYIFTIHQTGRMISYALPKSFIEREYGLLEAENYTFVAADVPSTPSNIVDLRRHPRFPKRKDSRPAIHKRINPARRSL